MHASEASFLAAERSEAVSSNPMSPSTRAPCGYPTPLDKAREVIRHRPLHNDSNAAVGPRCAMPLSRPATGLAARRQYLFPPTLFCNRKAKQLRSHFVKNLKRWVGSNGLSLNNTFVDIQNSGLAHIIGSSSHGNQLLRNLPESFSAIW